MKVGNAKEPPDALRGLPCASWRREAESKHALAGLGAMRAGLTAADPRDAQ